MYHTEGRPFPVKSNLLWRPFCSDVVLNGAVNNNYFRFASMAAFLVLGFFHFCVNHFAWSDSLRHEILLRSRNRIIVWPSVHHR